MPDTDAIDRYLDELVDRAGPLTNDQVERLAGILRPPRDSMRQSA